MANIPFGSLSVTTSPKTYRPFGFLSITTYPKTFQAEFRNDGSPEVRMNNVVVGETTDVEEGVKGIEKLGESHLLYGNHGEKLLLLGFLADQLPQYFKVGKKIKHLGYLEKNVRFLTSDQEMERGNVVLEVKKNPKFFTIA